MPHTISKMSDSPLQPASEVTAPTQVATSFPTASPADSVSPAAPLTLARLDESFDWRTPGQVVDLLEDAAQAMTECPHRRGSCVHLQHGRVVMTGDLHDHVLNLGRILPLARLEQNPDHHLILHEIIHGHRRVNGRDLSLRSLLRVASLVRLFPHQVHVLLSNHELAQVRSEGILKDGVSLVEAFDEGLEFLYGDEASEVRVALGRFVGAYPLAVKCSNGVLCAHSLPSPRVMETFDPTVLDRVLDPKDLRSGGSAHQMVWGRYLSQNVADKLAAAWGVQQFVLGHQPAEYGYETQAQSVLILASDHDRGMALPMDLREPVKDRDELIAKLVPLM